MPPDSAPWTSWLPGVLNSEQVRELLQADLLRGTVRPELSAFDLPLGDQAWQLQEGAVKPQGAHYLSDLQKSHLLTPLRPQDGAFQLEARKTYLIQLEPCFPYPSKLAEAHIYGQATAKSTIGRLDVLVRFVLDGMTGYENFSPAALRVSDGKMFVEITPLSFSIRVLIGKALSQLRLFYGPPKKAELRGPLLWATVVRGQDKQANGLLTVDLSPVSVGGLNASAFSILKKASKKCLDTFSLTAPPWEYWRLVTALGDEHSRRLRLEHGRFYILRSRERLWLPGEVAAYCQAIDESIGEMRIHYAGFVHPFFGQAGAGTPLIFEVRGHDFESQLRNGETMARLAFYRMSRPAPEKERGPATGGYQSQSLTLSKAFDVWPEKLKWLEDKDSNDEEQGSVIPMNEEPAS